MKLIYWAVGIIATAILWAWATDWYERRRAASVAGQLASGSPAQQGPQPAAS